MHPDFADWYSIAHISPNEVDLQARWAGVEAAVQQATAVDLLDAARLFYGLPLKDVGFLTRFRAPFKTADEKFSMLDGNLELRVLAGASLIAEFADGWASAAALLLTCGSFRELRAAPVGDIVRLARESLVAESAKLRERRPVELKAQQELATSLGQHVTAARAALKTAADPATVAPIGDAINELSTAITSLTQWAHAQEREQSMRREESDVLWWLFAEQSRDLRVPFDQIAFAPASLVVAKEMADLTRSIPAPYAALGFLDKAIRNAKGGAKAAAVTLADAVNSCPEQWRKDAASRREIDAVEDLCPALFALRKVVEAQGKKSWQEVFENVTGLKPTEKLAPRDLAQQAFEEWLLARSIADIAGKA